MALSEKAVSKPLNVTMLLLQCIGIVAVVWGHADIGGPDIPNFLNLAFPYYSWHMPFFIFISGYFFNRTDTAGKYILKKLKNHLLPAFLVNAACGVISMCIKRFGLASYGQDITLKSLFVTPFTTGYQFYIDVSLWFVFALVVIEIVACLMDRITKGRGDIAYLGVTLLASLYCCYKAYSNYEGTRGEYLNAAIRFGYLMFFFWLGVCYRKYGEKVLKRFLNYKISIIIFSVGATVLGVTGYKIVTNVRDMDYTTITVPNGYWVAVVSPIIATAFFLGIAYSLAPYFKNSRLLVAMGRNTRYVMYYHQLIFVLYALFIGALVKYGVINYEGFSFERMSESAYYTGGNVAVTFVLCIVATVVPIAICSFIDKQKRWISTIIYIVMIIAIAFCLYLAKFALN